MTTPAEHPNVALMHRYFEAFGADDADALREVVAEDAVHHFPGTSAIAGDWHGVDGLLHGIRDVAMTLGRGNNGFELLHVVAGDGFAITVHRDFYTGDDNHLDLRYVLYLRIEDGKVAETWELPFDQAENDRYFGEQAKASALLAARGAAS